MDDASIKSAITQMAPLHRIRALEHIKGTDNSEISELEARAVAICKQHANTLCQNIDISGSGANWAESYFASVIASDMADRWAEDDSVLDFDYASYLASLAHEPMYAGLPSTWKNTEAEIGYVATTLTSLHKAFKAYSRFNLFHFDREPIHNFFSEQIITGAQENTRLIVSSLSDTQLTIASSSSLYQTLLKQAGNVLSDVWTVNSRILINEYKDAPEAKKVALQKPYDLSIIKTQFKTSLGLLADSATESLKVSQSLSSNNFRMSN